MEISLELDDDTRNSVYKEFSPLTAKEAYNKLTDYTNMDAKKKTERWPEVWYAIAFMSSVHRANLFVLFEKNSAAWKRVDSGMYNKVAELQRNRAKYDSRINPFHTHKTQWKCPYPECNQENKVWEDVYPSCSHPECIGKEQIDKPCGFHIPCLLNAAGLNAAKGLEDNERSKKRKAEDGRNGYKTPQQKGAKTFPPSLLGKHGRRREWDVSDTGESDGEESDTGERDNKRVRNKLAPPDDDDRNGDSKSKFDVRQFTGKAVDDRNGDSTSKFDVRKFAGSFADLPKMGGKKKDEKRLKK